MKAIKNPSMLLLVAHPDDAEYHAGGLCASYRQLGRDVKMVSITDGSSGHHAMSPEDLVRRRRLEAKAAAGSIGAECEVWHFPDGRLTPTIELREQIIAEVREYKPDLVLTHRTCDYHPDHRAVATAVQDASYLFTVPLICPSVPALRNDPVVAYMVDEFSRPNPLRADAVIDIESCFDEVITLLSHHQSQFFEWLPYNHCTEDPVPDDEQQRHAWLKKWYTDMIGSRVSHFREQITDKFGADKANALKFIEAYEVSEYAGNTDQESLDALFPNRLSR